MSSSCTPTPRSQTLAEPATDIFHAATTCSGQIVVSSSRFFLCSGEIASSILPLLVPSPPPPPPISSASPILPLLPLSAIVVFASAPIRSASSSHQRRPAAPVRSRRPSLVPGSSSAPVILHWPPFFRSPQPQAFSELLPSPQPPLFFLCSGQIAASSILPLLFSSPSPPISSSSPIFPLLPASTNIVFAAFISFFLTRSWPALFPNPSHQQS
ncbi:hypothetical protein ACLOJK_015332 [Asimina triloba]